MSELTEEISYFAMAALLIVIVINVSFIPSLLLFGLTVLLFMSHSVIRFFLF